MIDTLYNVKTNCQNTTDSHRNVRYSDKFAIDIYQNQQDTSCCEEEIFISPKKKYLTMHYALTDTSSTLKV